MERIANDEPLTQRCRAHTHTHDGADRRTSSWVPLSRRAGGTPHAHSPARPTSTCWATELARTDPASSCAPQLFVALVARGTQIPLGRGLGPALVAMGRASGPSREPTTRALVRFGHANGGPRGGEQLCKKSVGEVRTLRRSALACDQLQASGGGRCHHESLGCLWGRSLYRMSMLGPGVHGRPEGPSARFRPQQGRSGLGFGRYSVFLAPALAVEPAFRRPDAIRRILSGPRNPAPQQKPGV